MRNDGSESDAGSNHEEDKEVCIVSLFTAIRELSEPFYCTEITDRPRGVNRNESMVGMGRLISPPLPLSGVYHGYWILQHDTTVHERPPLVTQFC
jgi:hypothetical protein